MFITVLFVSHSVTMASISSSLPLKLLRLRSSTGAIAREIALDEDIIAFLKEAHASSKRNGATSP